MIVYMHAHVVYDHIHVVYYSGRFTWTYGQGSEKSQHSETSRQKGLPHLGCTSGEVHTHLYRQNYMYMQNSIR